MSLIEQAAKRLEELRRAGVEVPDDASAATAAQATPSILERAMSANPRFARLSELFDAFLHCAQDVRRLKRNVACQARDGLC